MEEAHMSWHMWKWRKIRRGWFSVSTVWVPGIEFRFSGLAVRDFNYWAILLFQNYLSLINFFYMRRMVREENLLLWAIELMGSHAEDLSPGLKLLPPYYAMPPHLNTLCDVLKTWDLSLGMRNLPGIVVLAHASQIYPSLCLIMSISADLRAYAFSSAKWEYRWLLDKLKIGWDG